MQHMYHAIIGWLHGELTKSKLPSQPLMKLSMKLVPSQTPIIIDTMRAGEAFETSERPIG